MAGGVGIIIAVDTVIMVGDGGGVGTDIITTTGAMTGVMTGVIMIGVVGIGIGGN